MKSTIKISIVFISILALGFSFGFSQSAVDLTVQIKCPGKAKAGEDLKKSIKVFVTNSGKVAAKNFAVDLIISKNTAAPMKFAVYSAAFKEDALLLGGREFVKSLAPGQTKAVTLNGNNRIPADTPTGLYYLGAVVDPGNAVAEYDEANNMDFCAMKIKGGGTMPVLKYNDIDVTNVWLDDKCRIWVKHTNNGNLKIDKVFRERVWVNGVLKTDDTEHIILAPGAWISHGVGADPGVKVFGSAVVKVQVDVDNALVEINEANNIKSKKLYCKTLSKLNTIKKLDRNLLKPPGSTCPDPAAYRIKFKMLNHWETSRGEVEIKGIVKNIGTKMFKGNGVAYLYEGRVLKKSKKFTSLAPGALLSLKFSRTWYTPDHDTPPEYKLLILYKDPQVSTTLPVKGKDCNLKNNKLTRSGSGINDLFY